MGVYYNQCFLKFNVTAFHLFCRRCKKKNMYTKTFKKISGIVTTFSLLIGLVGPMTAFAATNPSLGAAATFSILAQTGITGTGTISGNVENNGIAAAITGLTTAMVGGTIYSSNGGSTTGSPPAATTVRDVAVQNNASTAYSSTIPGLGIEGTPIVGAELNGITRGPGVYDLAGAVITLSGGVLTLDGPGTYIFRTTGNLTSSGSINFINGARACDLFWNVGTDATINGTSFAGTILASTGIHFGAGVTLDGRALAVGADVTLLGTTISGPSCAAAPAQGGASGGNINVVKVVINDNGGTKTVSDFPLFVDGGPVTSGVTYNFPENRVYNISETSNAQYKSTFSGDCTSDGHLNLNPGDNRFCVITNNDIGAPIVVPPVPPLIDVVKVPSPLSLPNGPGLVKYTYTLRNIGTVPVTNITMVGDTCSPIVLVSGDTNNDAKLDLNEAWVHTCSTTLTATHTNNVVATGWANGLSATDIASATVVVGAPLVPPLIHVTKLPSPLALKAGGGLVTYTEKITNPGTVALSHVSLVDDKCAPMKFISGDANSNNLLETTETWTYTCQSNLTQTTTNTAIAAGEANGMNVRDFAIATVVVADVIPKLPNTGFFSDGQNTSWGIAALSSLFAVSLVLYVIRKKKNV